VRPIRAIRAIRAFRAFRGQKTPLEKSCKKLPPVCDALGEGCSRGRTQIRRRAPLTRTTGLQQQKSNTMKTLTKIALLIVALSAAASAEAQMVRGYFRSNGTYVAPYYRTPANSIPYDNLSYRGYPSQQPGYVSPRKYSLGAAHSDFTALLPRSSASDWGCVRTPRSSTLQDDFSLHSPFSWGTGALSGRSSGFGGSPLPKFSGPFFSW
jgi:hypothetical protein